MSLISQIYCSYRLWRRYANVAHLLRFLLSVEGKSRLEIGSSLTPIPPTAFSSSKRGSPGGLDEWGDRAESAVKQAAKQVADLVGASPREIIVK